MHIIFNEYIKKTQFSDYYCRRTLAQNIAHISHFCQKQNYLSKCSQKIEDLKKDQVSIYGIIYSIARINFISNLFYL